MPDRKDFTLTAPDGAKLRCYEWTVENPKAVMVIVHGMAEHARRYGRFAGALNANGIAAVSMDLRGHGQTAVGGTKGYFAKKNGWKLVLEDIHQLSQWAAERYPGTSMILLGHSIGSMFARAAMFSYPSLFKAYVLTAVSVDLPLRRRVAPLIAGALSLVSGRNNPAPLLDNLTFGAFNKPYAPARTKFDWLNRDTAEVDKYIADPDCGFICTGSCFVDFSWLLLATLKRSNIARVPKGSPVLILSGSDDPAGCNGKTARFLERQYRDAELDVAVKIYEHARHELINETNRDEVTADILAFVNGKLGL